jgi:hypothetical protein
MIAANPQLTNSEIDSILRLTAVHIDAINPSYIGRIGSGRLNAADAVRIAYDMTLEVEDGNNGHGNDEDGVDSSNPGNGNGNGNAGGNGNHYGWDKNNKNTLSDNSATITTYDMMGKEINLEYAPVGYYFVKGNGTITKIYKNY